ncbi:MAG: DMT family transporter, partial [Alphaproteobacteria bacterium]|nr:DMT family transporter [Alphaproteobacteria bacterium]
LAKSTRKKATPRPMPWHSNHVKLQLLRGALMMVVMLLNVLVVKHFSLSFFGAMFYTSPFWVAVLAIPLLGEKIGWRRWTAICIGFSGVLFIIRPFGGETLSWLVLPAILSPLGFGLFSILTRKVAIAGDSFLPSFFYMTLFGSVFLLPWVIEHWQTPPDLFTWVLFLGPGLVSSFGHGLLILAARHCSASIIAPFIYLEMLMFTFYDLVVFQVSLDRYVIMGAMIISVSGLVMWARERKLARIRALRTP